MMMMPTFPRSVFGFKIWHMPCAGWAGGWMVGQVLSHWFVNLPLLNVQWQDWPAPILCRWLPEGSVSWTAFQLFNILLTINKEREIFKNWDCSTNFCRRTRLWLTRLRFQFALITAWVRLDMFINNKCSPTRLIQNSTLFKARNPVCEGGLGQLWIYSFNISHVIGCACAELWGQES